MTCASRELVRTQTIGSTGNPLVVAIRDTFGILVDLDDYPTKQAFIYVDGDPQGAALALEKFETIPGYNGRHVWTLAEVTRTAGVYNLDIEVTDGGGQTLRVLYRIEFVG